MTYGEIRLRLTQLLPSIDPELIDGWISDRYQAILDRLTWQRRDASTSIPTVIGADIIRLPADCRVLKSIRGPLGPLGYWDATKHVIGTITGTPQAWRPVWDSATVPPQQQLQIWPVPDAVYTLTVEYTAEEGTFNADSPAVSLLPWLRPSALVAGVNADGLLHLENFSASDRKEAQFEKYLNDMIRTEAKRTPAKAIRLAAKYDPSRQTGIWPVRRLP